MFFIVVYNTKDIVYWPQSMLLIGEVLDNASYTLYSSNLCGAWVEPVMWKHGA